LKVASGIAASASFAVAGLLLIWGGWLVATDDPDGGRHLVGAVVLVVAVLCVVVGVISFRRSRRR
jgi:membrane protein DedA with SNARE-associated domain